MVITGIMVQLVACRLFLIVTTTFHRRMVCRPSVASETISLPWKQFLSVLYAVLVLILVRCIFRAVEYLQGQDGYLITHEIWLYIFDALLMFGVMIILNVYHPSRIITGKDRRHKDFTLSNMLNQDCS
ncbi:unnamed protein product [Fusarium venenatum]|uniref:RTA1 like protein n=1 Tax=Fusarium venenatum TaxID=56646 RepID=A0A2L2TTZ0_9HYPO|nr:uncharacterized protein FVRRES_00127 [Fusarium venenatum]CEI63615.1 unnamed protein product [Fusarium venenatum]